MYFTRRHTSKDTNQTIRAGTSGRKRNGGGKWRWAPGVQGSGGGADKEGNLAWIDAVVLWTKAFDKCFTWGPGKKERKNTQKTNTKMDEYLLLLDSLLFIGKSKNPNDFFCLKWGGWYKSSMADRLGGGGDILKPLRRVVLIQQCRSNGPGNRL